MFELTLRTTEEVKKALANEILIDFTKIPISINIKSPLKYSLNGRLVSVFICNPSNNKIFDVDINGSSRFVNMQTVDINLGEEDFDIEMYGQGGRFTFRHEVKSLNIFPSSEEVMPIY